MTAGMMVISELMVVSLCAAATAFGLASLASRSV